MFMRRNYTESLKAASAFPPARPRLSVLPACPAGGTGGGGAGVVRGGVQPLGGAGAGVSGTCAGSARRNVLPIAR